MRGNAAEDDDQRRIGRADALPGELGFVEGCARFEDEGLWQREFAFEPLHGRYGGDGRCLGVGMTLRFGAHFGLVFHYLTQRDDTPTANVRLIFTGSTAAVRAADLAGIGTNGRIVPHVAVGFCNGCPGFAGPVPQPVLMSTGRMLRRQYLDVKTFRRLDV